jgi:LysM repeat protein
MAATYTVKAGDTLNGIASQYGFSNYKTAGITGYGANADKIAVGTVLTIGGAKPASTSPTPPAGGSTGGTTTDAHSLINGTQTDDQKNASTKDDPGVSSGSSSLVDAYAAIAKAITPKTKAPDAPSLTDTYKKLRGDYGVDDLETSLTDLNAQKQAIKDQFQVQYDAETGKPVAMNVIEGRVSEEEKAANQRVAAIDAQISTVNSQLTTKYNVISSLMTYTQQDYTNAKGQYDTELSQNLQMINLAKGIKDDAKSDEEAAKDDARANLQIIYNNIAAKGGGATVTDPTTKNTITKLELQAGLPTGFYSTIAADNPGGQILSTTTRDSGGIKYADVIVKNQDGSLSTKTVKLGAADASSTSTKLTDGEKKSAGYAAINQLLTKKDSSGMPYTDGDGYFTAQGFKNLMSAAIEDGITRSDFIGQYADRISPSGAKSYGLTVKEQTDLGI